MLAQINPQLLAVTAIAQNDRKEITPYNGVRVEPSSQGGILLIATTGNILTVAHDIDGSCSEPFTFLPSVEILKVAKTSAATSVEVSSDVEVIDKNQYRIMTGMLNLSEGFPDWRNIIPCVIPGMVQTTHKSMFFIKAFDIVVKQAKLFDKEQTFELLTFGPETAKGPQLIKYTNQPVFTLIAPSEKEYDISQELPFII